ncbi:ATP-binding cassette domain-containing protein [Bacillus lacus]|uniref:ATP-binding cassette domain-containing protein n=1 Tax=Metabacillus lacus TaxID=1983721 RepID=A0A7X2M183_9BACI|nr:ABC transporter ATP-binding protein [Metabacillus lacus]MRX73819.1 ATP-binding cassette domain-containing protein [Metabacillus lacus]
MNVITCSNVTKQFGKKYAVNGLNCRIEENKITGVIGRNGAGKSTLLKMIAGYLKKSSGDISVFGTHPFNSLDVSINSIYIDDQMIFPPSMQLEELLETAGSFYPNWDEKLAWKLFHYFSLDKKQYHHHLSKGQTSTFNFIIGIASRCSLTILDEPVSGLDAGARKDFYRALLKDYIAYPRTILLSSHHMEEIEDLLEDVLLLKEGREILHMPVSGLKEFAVGLKGSKKVISQVVKDKKVFFYRDLHSHMSYAAVENTFTKAELQNMRTQDLFLSAVSAADLCIYLTQDEKGGIDDVFSES